MLTSVNAEIQNQSQNVVQINIADTAPAASERGRNMLPNVLWQVELQAGQTVYGKTENTAEFGVFPI